MIGKFVSSSRCDSKEIENSNRCGQESDTSVVVASVITLTESTPMTSVKRSQDKPAFRAQIDFIVDVTPDAIEKHI